MENIVNLNCSPEDNDRMIKFHYKIMYNPEYKVDIEIIKNVSTYDYIKSIWNNNIFFPKEENSQN